MPDSEEIATWYQDDDHFEPTALLTAHEQEIVLRAEEAAAGDGTDATFADVLIALHEYTRK